MRTDVGIGPRVKLQPRQAHLHKFLWERIVKPCHAGKNQTELKHHAVNWRTNFDKF